MSEVTELLSTLVSWPMFVAALIVYGFAPGFLLRLIVLGYEKGHPRRDELVSTMYEEVPYYKRPFWVLAQFETMLADGMVPRLRWAATGRIILRWRIASGVKQNRRHPDTFWIPSPEEKAALIPGDVVKLMFLQSDGWGERMWVRIEKAGRFRLVGRLDNQPLDFPRLYPGRKLRFRRSHIIDIHPEPDDVPCYECVAEQEPRVRPMCDECAATMSDSLAPDDRTEEEDPQLGHA